MTFGASAFVWILVVTSWAEESWVARPDVVSKFEGRRGQFNYQEAKVPQFVLPDPLVTLSGNTVSSAEAWDGARRGELLELFRHHVYGRRPAIDHSVRFEEEASIPDAFNGIGRGIRVKAVVSIGERTFSFPFVAFVPKNSESPVPVVVHINNRYFIPLETAAAETNPFWPARDIIKKGYATASFHTSDVDPDRKDGYAEGIRSFFADGKPPKDEAWRSLSAWRWAASRVLDYMLTLSETSKDQSAVVGHSRGGKTALWAACEDTRFQIAYSNNSGCGGAALSRRVYGETVGRITTNFPHWFCKNFSRYSNREAELPVDQHEVMALIAPRGVYVASADEDLWADPRGEYQALVAAEPVFRLLGRDAIASESMPSLNHPRVVGSTGYHIRTGGHGLEAEDWQWFLEFADELFER